MTNKTSTISLLLLLVLGIVGPAQAGSSNTTPGGNMANITGLVIESIETQPIPPHIKEIAMRQHQQMKERGFADAPEDDVTVLERYSLKKNQKYIKTMEEIADKLAIQPAILEGTPFEKGKFIGALTAGGLVDTGWTGLERLYTIPRLGLVKLEEYDYIAAGGGTTIAKEFINENINGHPAVFMVKQSLSDKATTELTWVTQQKIFTLTTNKKMGKDDTSMILLKDLAKSITSPVR